MEYYSWRHTNRGLRLTGAFILLIVSTALPIRAQEAGVGEIIRRGEAMGIDANLLQTVDDRALERGLNSARRAQLLEMGVALAEQELPAEAVLQKALEGLAKQIPQPQLLSVLSRMQQQTVEAGRVVDSWMQQPDARRIAGEAQTENARGRRLLIQNVAEALVHDVPRSTVAGLLKRISTEIRRGDISAADVGAAVGVLADLPSGRQEPEPTIGLLVSALNAGYSESDIRRLPLAIRAAEDRGMSTAQAASEAASAMNRGTPADDVLRSLFGGEFPSSPVRVGGADGGPPSSVGPPPGIGPDDAGIGRGGNDNANPRGRDN